MDKVAMRGDTSKKSDPEVPVDRSKLPGGAPQEPREVDISKLAAMLRDPLCRSISLQILVILAVFYTLYVARVVFVPIVMAVLLSTMLMPLARRLNRFHVPMVLASTIILLALISILLVAGYWISEPATAWLSKLPEALRKAEFKIRDLTGSVESLSKTTDQVSKIAERITDPAEPALKVEIQETSFASFLLGWTQEMAAATAITAILLFFLLASGNVFMRKLVRIIPRMNDKKRAVEIVRQIQADVARYTLTITAIYVVVGVIVGMFAYCVGLPDPVLIGIMAGLLNFIPYVGALVGVGVFGLLSLLHFDTVAPALLSTAAYFSIVSLEGGFITPAILGRRLSLSPVIVIIGLMVFTGIWGPIGAILTFPLLASLKIILDRVEALTPVSEFLGT